MSSLAGYDFVIEWSIKLILDKIKENTKIYGIPLIPPFEFTIPLVKNNNQFGNIHFIITDLGINIISDNSFDLYLIFEDTSINITWPKTCNICPLDGKISYKSNIMLKTVNQDEKILAIDYDSSATTVAFSDDSEEIINFTLYECGMTDLDYKIFINEFLNNDVNLFESLSLPIEKKFIVDPIKNGSIDPLRFTNIEVHFIDDVNKSKQALGVFGNLLVSTINNGNYREKVSLVNSLQNVAYSVSAQAFGELFICSKFANIMRVETYRLPMNCGDANDLPYEGISITSLGYSFESGIIKIWAMASDSGKCYEANASIYCLLGLNIIANKIFPTITISQPTIDVDVPVWCKVIGTIIDPLIGGAFFLFDYLIDKIVNDLAGSFIDTLNQSLLPQNISFENLDIIDLNEINISPEGLYMLGRIDVFYNKSTFEKKLDFEGNVYVLNIETIGSGILNTHIWCQDDAKDYSYTERLIHQEATYRITSSMLTIPLQVKYKIYWLKYLGSEDRQIGIIEINEGSGTLILSDIESTYIYAPGEITKIVQNVEVNYEI